MANTLYDLGRQKFLDGFVSWERDDIRLALVDGDDYTENLATDEFLSDIAGGALVAQSGAFANKTSAGGVADADDVVLSSVSGDQSEALVIYRNVPTASGTGNDLGTPDGNGIQLVTDTGGGLFTAAMERGFISISGATGGNNGNFFVTEFVDTDNVRIYNPGGALETVAFTYSMESPLLAFLDSVTGLPVTPNGGDITVAWDNGANKIFKL